MWEPILSVCVCVYLLVQWCEAAGLWLSVRQHTRSGEDNAPVVLDDASGTRLKWFKMAQQWEVRRGVELLAAPGGHIVRKRHATCANTIKSFLISLSKHEYVVFLLV